jgi:uncharacterized membrane protein YfcA
MTPALILALTITMVATAFLSGIFGMAGGMILIGVLLFLLPLPAAMVLHAVTQMASNAWRAILWWRYIVWRPVAAYAGGCALALLAWSVWRYTPSTPVALLLLGVTPFMARAVPDGFKPDPDSAVQGAFYGTVCMTLLLLTGVSGPLIDTYFLGGKLDRRQIVATKAVCQVFGHAAKFIYFGALIDQAAALDPLMAGLAIAASMIGTTLARRVLEAMSDVQYRLWANRIITAIARYYVVYGSYLLLAR